MAGPLMSAPVSAQQVAQQKLQEQAQPQQQKQGASKFDGVMAEKAQAARPPDGVQATQATQASQRADGVQAASAVQQPPAAQKVQGSARAAQLAPQKVGQASEGGSNLKDVAALFGKNEAAGAKGAGAPGQGKAVNMAVQMMDNIQQGQGVMDKLIEAGLSGKQFSNGELIALQAGVYKYSQELELTGKVVEKATTGLKDTLKTQV